MNRDEILFVVSNWIFQDQIDNTAGVVDKESEENHSSIGSADSERKLFLTPIEIMT